MKGIIGYFRALLSTQFAPTGIRVAVVVGTILLTINHGYAIVTSLITDLSFFSDR
ncbi:MAG: nitrate/nitrite transporter NrtS [Microcystis sp. M090S1]|uniref:nitrate/nitrite transporter NrtS n=1 Tax=Microcystis sp. M090S1 TaxID=2771135 RepID=UPI00258F17D6|nr:nitrate/nitrite transporter NrtS [Microcystis sp. M090S1]MCA2811749.1 nitrate/nitrite transporter NrtS [Microcystis sp. M090S1]